jgi:alanine or glycine:cation symporter, AGCS family
MALLGFPKRRGHILIATYFAITFGLITAASIGAYLEYQEESGSTQQSDESSDEGAAAGDQADNSEGSVENAEPDPGDQTGDAGEQPSDSTSAETGEPAEPSEFMKRLKRFEGEADDWFGKYLVKPLDMIIFYDFGTPNYLKNNSYWQKVINAKQPDETKFLISRIGENGIRVDVVATTNGQLTVKRMEADSEEELQEKHPEAYTIYTAHATKENRVGIKIPFVVVWLLFGGVFFTIRMSFINIRAFWHAIRLTSGAYDKKDSKEKGEVSHFQALCAALSATVGLGNIAGVAIAIGSGGPGAVVWMVLIGIFGMTTKFTECTLGQMYRKEDKDGHVNGGPMHYLKEGLAKLGLAPLGYILAFLFSILCIGASFGGGNAFQINQSLGAIREDSALSILNQHPWIYGAVMVVLVGLVIIGGIKSIGRVAGAIVPLMCIAYVAASLYIIGTHSDRIGPAFARILSEAWSPDAAYGGFLGVLVIGITRAVFSNEAGTGSASIAHSAAKTDIPVREGIVALLEPFIDTVVVCTMTALVIIITGVADDPNNAGLIYENKGAALTSIAFAEKVEWFKWILYASVVLFAFSTCISWSYYGERCWTHWFGVKSSMVYKVLFLAFTFLGSIVGASNIKDFSDLLILGLALPNVLGLLILSGSVRRELDTYWTRVKAGEFKKK